MKLLAVLLAATLLSPAFGEPPDRSKATDRPGKGEKAERPSRGRPRPHAPAPGGTDYWTPPYIPTPGTQLSAPEYKSSPSTPSEPTPKAPKAPKVAPKKGKVKAPGGENQLGPKMPPPPPPGGKAIVGPRDSATAKR